jgi:hypothetical protein
MGNLTRPINPTVVVLLRLYDIPTISSTDEQTPNSCSGAVVDGGARSRAAPDRLGFAQTTAVDPARRRPLQRIAQIWSQRVEVLIPSIRSGQDTNAPCRLGAASVRPSGREGRQADCYGFGDALAEGEDVRPAGVGS